MTAVMADHGPGAAAELAAEAVGTLNHLTLGPPSAGTPRWEDVTDLYRVLAELCVLAERLPQVIGQLARHFERPVGARYRCDAGTTAPPDVLVARAAGSLDAAVSPCKTQDAISTTRRKRSLTWRRAATPVGDGPGLEGHGRAFVTRWRSRRLRCLVRA